MKPFSRLLVSCVALFGLLAFATPASARPTHQLSAFRVGSFRIHDPSVNYRLFTSTPYGRHFHRSRYAYGYPYGYRYGVPEGYSDEPVREVENPYGPPVPLSPEEAALTDRLSFPGRTYLP